jgi:Flp pilus assembly pilin Flp
MIELANRATIALWMRLRREEGQTFVEYAVLTAVVAIGIVAALGLFRGQIVTALTNIGNAIP